MYTYSLTSNSTIQRSDGACIPPDPANRDYQSYLTWVSEGNTASPYVVPQVDLIAQVNTFRDQLLAAGFVDTGHTGKTWQCDPASIGLLTAVGSSAGLNLSVSPQPTFSLIPSDNTINTYNATDAYALIAGRIMPWVSDTMVYARTLKNDILAGNPPADYTQGWPNA